MGIEENKEVVRQYFELLNQREPDAANELLSPDYNIGGYTREDNRQNDARVFKAFPDVKWTISDMTAEGDRVAFIDSVSGTHTGGPFMGIPPTGKKIDGTNTWITRITDNKIVEHNGTGDFLTPLQQLGVAPSLPEILQAYNESLK
jgi:predicted ester cyclase